MSIAESQAEIGIVFSPLAENWADAAYAVGRLAESLEDPPATADPAEIPPATAALLADLCRREALASARLQGFAATPESLLRQIDDPLAGGEDRNALVAFDAYRAVRSAVYGGADRHLTVDGLLDLERRLTLLARGGDDSRVDPAAGNGAVAARFLALWGDLADRPGLLRAGIALHALHALPPIGLSNARLGRLLLPLLTADAGLTARPALMISAELARRPAVYRAMAAGPLESWLAFYLAAVAAAARAACKRRAGLALLRRHYLESCPPGRSTSRIGAAIDLLFDAPAVSVYRLQRALDLSYRGAQTVIDRLTAAGIVAEITGRRRDRLFLAHRIASPL